MHEGLRSHVGIIATVGGSGETKRGIIVSVFRSVTDNSQAKPLHAEFGVAL